MKTSTPDPRSRRVSPFQRGRPLRLGALVLLLTLGTQRPALAQDVARYVTHVTPAGETVRLVASADDDGDGIDNALEVNGYTYAPIGGLQPWNGDAAVVHYVTDPRQWSTDGDPYSDFMEVSGVNMPSGVDHPYADPLVAARPVIAVYMDSYDVVPNADITDTEGHTVGSSYTNETTNEDQVGGSVTVGAELNPFKLASVEVEGNYSHTWVQTESTTRETSLDWSTARTTNPSQAARLKLNLYLVNRGSATALRVRPTVSLLLGDKTIATITPDQQANRLAPGARYPTDGTITVENALVGGSGDFIWITLDELKALESGTPLSLVVTQVSAGVVRWNPDTESFDGEVDWDSFEEQIDPVTVTIQAELGEREVYEYQVFAGNPFHDPGYTLRDVLQRVFSLEERGGTTLINGRPYPDAWYPSTPSPAIVEAWEAAGQPTNMLDLPMTRGTRLLLASPGPEPGPIVRLATYTQDLGHVLVSALPTGGFPIVSVTANVVVDGAAREVTLGRSEGEVFFTTADAFETAPEPGGTVTVTDARGDARTVPIRPPALEANCVDVGRFTIAETPEDGEYLVFVDHDLATPADVYCRFKNHDGMALDAPETYFWVPQDVADKDIILYGVEFVTDRVGFIVGSAGTLLRTDDGGRTWAPVPLDTALSLYDVTFADSLTGMISGADGHIYGTVDGGASWVLVSDITSRGLFTIETPAPGTWVAVGLDRVIRSTDGGLTWSGGPIGGGGGPIGGGGGLTDVAFKDAATGLAVEDRGPIFRTDDGGATWTQMPQAFDLLGLDHVHGDTFVAVGYGTIARTTDGGQTWEDVAPLQDHPPIELFDVHFATDSIGFAVGWHEILRTDDGGRTWTFQEDPLAVGTELYGVHMRDANRGVAVGYGGELVWTNAGGGQPVTTGGAVGTPVEDDPARELPQQLTLDQNYPNPFNPTTTISYRLARSQEVRLEVFDLLGQRVAVLVDGLQAAGVHEVRFDASNLASGLYVYRLHAEDTAQTRKMTLLR